MAWKKIYSVFPYGKCKALTLSYDDGNINDIRLSSIFRKYGLKATFNLNSGLSDNDETRIKKREWKDVYSDFELASHTVTHPTLSRQPLSRVVEEILEDRKAIESITGSPVRGFAYPNGVYTPEIVSLLPSLGISYARIVGDTDSFDIPDDFYRWKATCHHNHRLLENARTFLEFNKPWYLKLMYVWGHSFEFPRDDNWSLMEEFARLVGGRDEIWYATNIEIVDYLEASRRLIYTADCSKVFNPSAMDVWITLDDAPLCLKGGTLTEL